MLTIMSKTHAYVFDVFKKHNIVSVRNNIAVRKYRSVTM